MSASSKPTTWCGSPAHFLAALSILAGIYFALTVVALHFLPTGYDPGRQVISDYAVGPYGIMMDSGFVAAGIGGITLASALSFRKGVRRAYRVGTVLIFVAGAATLSLGAFPIDLQGAAVTTHGAIHSLATLVVFVLQPVGILLVSYTFGRGEFFLSLTALMAAGVIFGLVGGLSLNAMGLSERIFVAVISSWSLLVSIDVYKHSKSRLRP